MSLPTGSAHAKALLLMQQGIGLYETVSTSIASAVGGDVDVVDLDTLTSGEQLEKLVAAKKSEAIVSVGVAAAKLVASAGLRVPVVFCLVPQREVAGLKRVNGTGVTLEVPFAAQLAAIRGVLPRASRFGVLYDPKVSSELIAEVREAAKRSGLVLVETPVDDPGKLATLLGGTLGKVDAVWMIQDRTVGNALGFKVLLVGTLERRVPLVAYSASFVENGALVSLAPDFDAMAKITAGMLTRILAGAAPSSIPWQEGPGTLVINTRVAGTLGIEVPATAARTARLVH